MQTRRTFVQNALNLLLTTSLLNSLVQIDVFGNSIKPILKRWLIDVEEISYDLKTKKVSQIEWQKKIEELFSKVSLDELLKLINFHKLSKKLVYANHGVYMQSVKFPVIEGLPSEQSFVKLFFIVDKNHAIVPHGHHNMATMHMILKGEMQSWHYDRVRDEKDFIIIKPSDYRISKVGDVSTISDEKDNVHWFKAGNEASFAFNIGVYDLDPNKDSARDYLDPNGEKLKDGLIRAPKISYKEAVKKYN
jgi:hypothetical protein